MVEVSSMVPVEGLSAAVHDVPVCMVTVLYSWFQSSGLG